MYTQNTGDRHQGFSGQESYFQGSSKSCMKEIAFFNNSGTESAFSLILVGGVIGLTCTGDSGQSICVFHSARLLSSLVLLFVTGFD